jgi:hypothetical protein
MPTTKKPLSFRKCGLHNSIGVSCNKKLTAQQISDALAGKYGKKAVSQARFYRNVLSKGGRKKR